MKLLKTRYKCAGESSDENHVTNFFLTSKRVLCRPESGKYGHFKVLNRSVKEGFGIMNAKIIFSEAPYGIKRSLKISNHLVIICIFYRPEGDQFFTVFMVQNHKIEDIFTIQ